MATHTSAATPATAVPPTATAEGETHEADAAAAEDVPLPRHSVAILAEIKRAQLAHGLRYADFLRYRHYCTRRIRRICKYIRLLHGRHRYQKRNLTPGMLTTQRGLMLPLYYAERAWSYGMQLRDDNTKGDARMRYHMIRRFRKAAFWGQKLHQFTLTCGDEATQKEARAYSAWQQGVFAFIRALWTEAFGLLLEARHLYAELGGGVPGPYQERVDELDQTFLRICLHNAPQLASPATAQVSAASSAAPVPISFEVEKPKQTTKAAAPKPVRAPKAEPKRMRVRKDPRTVVVEPPQPCKPLVFDIASNHLVFPSLETRKAKKGIFQSISNLFSWGGR